MSDDEMEDYGFEYSEDELEQDGDADVENQYYNSKGLLEGDDHAAALASFREVLSLEAASSGAAPDAPPGEWGFKALKQICKVHSTRGDADGLLADYGRMLAAAEAGTVSRAAAEKKLASLLDHLASAAPGRPCLPPALLARVFSATLAAAAAPDRLKFRTRLRLATLWLDGGDHARADAALRDLRASAAGDHASGGTALLDVLAAEIRLHTATGDGRRLKDAHRAALAVVKAAIPHPRVLGTVRACGGALALADGAFADAASAFFDAFKAYDEAGDPARAACLKHAVLASMLAGTGVDPLDAQEARPLRTDPAVAPMVELAAAFADGDVKLFERTLVRHRPAFEDDPVVVPNIGDLRATVLARRARRLLAPYSRVRLAAVAEGLGVSVGDAESLVAGLILDGALDAAVDQVTGTVDLGGEGGGAGDRGKGVASWAGRVKALSSATASRLQVA